MTTEQWTPWVWVRWNNNASSTSWENWRSNSKITGAWSTIGEWDCVFWVDVTTNDELEKFVWETFRQNDTVAATQTAWTKKWW